jgi:propionyl-CoA carboxylase beta chain
MGAKGAAEIIFKKEIDSASDRLQAWKEKETEYSTIFANPYRAAERGFVDEVILPEETRSRLIVAFEMLENKVVNMPKKKHGNIPL